MRLPSLRECVVAGALSILLAGCGDRFSGSSRVNASSGEVVNTTTGEVLVTPANAGDREPGEYQDRGTIWDLFGTRDDPNNTVAVNRYIWNAALDVLDFLPIQTADPFSGILVFGYGTPPGSGQSYRATVYVQDAALDARSLRLAIANRSGPVSADTVRAVEDAILTRARQLRIQDDAL